MSAGTPNVNSLSGQDAPGSSTPPDKNGPKAEFINSIIEGIKDILKRHLTMQCDHFEEIVELGAQVGSGRDQDGTAFDTGWRAQMTKFKQILEVPEEVWHLLELGKKMACVEATGGPGGVDEPTSGLKSNAAQVDGGEGGAGASSPAGPSISGAAMLKVEG